ncbi:MAG: nicotinate-nucleotide diphosphorylase, partial [Planctomycetota bacterium]
MSLPTTPDVLPDLNAIDLAELFEVLNPARDLRTLFDRVHLEDLGSVGDVTTAATIDPKSVGRAVVMAREAGVISGLRTIPMLIDSYNAELTWRPFIEDGARVATKMKVGELRGRLSDLLALERPMLNLLMRLSGIATLTARYVELTEGTHASIYDTRKTTPCMRGLEKYAVRCGGGKCHRIGLHDAILIKDNHLAALTARDRETHCGRPLHEMLTHAMQAVRARQPL